MVMPPAAELPSVRLRLVFDSRRLLQRAQRDEGLRRCWLLLRPELATVADLATHVADRFCLGRSCPRGVVLSMDGFTLPPFESTGIFRDKDIIRVKQKSSKNMIEHHDVGCIQDPVIVEKRLLPTDDKILAIEYKTNDNKHQDKEQCGHQQQEIATTSHCIESKRKCRDGDAGVPENSRKKKPKVVNPENDVDVNNEDDAHQHNDQNASKNLMFPSTDSITTKATLRTESTCFLEEKQKTDKTDRNHQTELNCETKVANCNAQSDKKLVSRSARRKKLKRRLKQEAKAQLEKRIQEDSRTAADCPSSNNQDGCPPSRQNAVFCASQNQNKSQVTSSAHKTDEVESDSSEDIVPVVVRPGHIRFEQAGREQKSPANETQGTFQWSATMSKKKGQKWGMTNSKKKSTDMNYDARVIGSSTEVSHHEVDSKINENGSCGASDQNVKDGNINNPARVNTVADEEKSSGGPLDFESLYPLTRLPKEGDLIAYRLVELSSSWCPELSSYRVGKVLIYDPVSLRIILVPVPEYPVISEERKTEEESDTDLDMSLYNEDGSLEIEYSSLLDVRLLLKGNESASAAICTNVMENGKKDISLAGAPNTLDKINGNNDGKKALMLQNNTRTSEGTSEKTQKTVWEETGEAPNDKSDAQENGWGHWTPNASTSAWSLRALRSSAIGPTVAILRGKNNQRGKSCNRKYGN